MKAQLRSFVERHPEGWNHDDWLALLTELQQAGADVSEPDSVGLRLERARLEWELARRSPKGLGPRRREALVDRFGTLWSLKHASIEDVAALPSIPRAVAKEVLSALA